jgi:hypothetical protein
MPCTPDTGDWASAAAANHDALHAWVFSLPWVVERQYSFGVRGVRIFAVDCPPLGVREAWLVTGLPMSSGVAVVVPFSLAEHFELLHLTECIAPMPAEHVLASLCSTADDRDVERVVLAAYASSLASHSELH